MKASVEIGRGGGQLRRSGHAEGRRGSATGGSHLGAMWQVHPRERPKRTPHPSPRDRKGTRGELSEPLRIKTKVKKKMIINNTQKEKELNQVPMAVICKRHI